MLVCTIGANACRTKLAWISGLLLSWDSKTSTQLLRLSSVYLESLCGGDVGPATKNLLEQASILVGRPTGAPGGLEELEFEFANLGFKCLSNSHVLQEETGGGWFAFEFVGWR